MAGAFEKDPEQERIIKMMVEDESGAAINGSGTGLGKTYCAIRVGHERGGSRFLVIAPPNTFENWASTVKAVTGSDLMFCGNKAMEPFSAKESQQNMRDAQDGKPGWYFVGREMFLSQQRVRVLVQKREGGKLVPSIDPKTKKQRVRVDFKYVWGEKVPFDFAVYDECQMASSNASKSNQALGKLQARYKLAQSADWWGTDMENMYTVAKMLWPSFIGNMTRKTWRSAYFNTEYDHHAYDKERIESELWEGGFASDLPCYVALPSPIDKPKPEPLYVDLSPEQRKLYDKLSKDMAAELDGDVLVTKLPLHLDMRLRELALGLFRIDYKQVRSESGEMIEKQTIRFEVGDPSTKIDAIRSIMKDYPGEPILIATGSKKWAIKAAEELGGLPYTGDQTEAEKEEAKQKFLRGEVRVLVGTSAIAEGLDGLQSVCRLSVIASRLSVPYKNEQFLGRTARRGQKRPVIAYELIARKTKDAGIVDKSITTILRNNAAKAVEAKAKS